MKKSKQYSLWSLTFIFVFIFFIFFYFDLWHKNRITLDAPSYYTYLPATFIHQDLKLNFIDTDKEFYKDKIWYYKIENGNRLIKHPMGISVMISPFFAAGHIIAKISGAKQDGYSLPYQNAVSFGILFYLFTGLYFLRKLLLKFYSEKVTALTLISITLATNLLWYSTVEGFMPHAISFSLLCISMYVFYKWLNTGMKKYMLAFALVFGLSVLVRPLAITVILYFLIYAFISKGGIRYFIAFIKPQLKNILIALLLFFVIVSLQLFYWKCITGSWLYDVYIDEHFVFNSPQMMPFLFSFRKGLFVYTPILLFSLIGLLIFFKTKKALFYSTLTIFLLSVFLLSSWWAWSYGISWGMRPMIDYYSVLSLPIAAAFSFILQKRNWSNIILFGVITIFIALNLFQTWQYKNGLIHYDDMSKEAYFKGFFQTKITPEWVDMLKPYDWDRRIKGLPQVKYTKEYLNSLNEKDAVYFRGYNLMYLSVNEKAEKVVAAYVKSAGNNGLFYIQRLNDDTVCLRSANGLLLSVKDNYDRIISASAMMPGTTEKFIIEYIKEGDNRIALKALNGKYVSVDSSFPFMIHANAGTVGKEEIFRFYVLNKE